MAHSSFGYNSYSNGSPTGTGNTLNSPTSQLLVPTPVSPMAATPHCCESSRSLMTDPHTGQTVCSCQYSPSIGLSYATRVSLPESIYSSAYSSTPGYLPHISADPSTLYPSLNTAYDVKENTELWHGLPPTAYPYDYTLAGYPYPSYASDFNGVRRKNATRENTNTLKAWLNEHKKNPYPTKGEKIMLAIITKMSLTQVSTWFANARRRLKKEKGWCGNDEDDEGDNSEDRKNDKNENSNLGSDGGQDNDMHSPGSSSDLNTSGGSSLENGHVLNNNGNEALVQMSQTQLPHPDANALRTPPYPADDSCSRRLSTLSDANSDKTKIWSIVHTATSSVNSNGCRFSPPTERQDLLNGAPSSGLPTQQPQSFRVISKPGQNFPDPLAGHGELLSPGNTFYNNNTQQAPTNTNTNRHYGSHASPLGGGVPPQQHSPLNQGGYTTQASCMSNLNVTNSNDYSRLSTEPYHRLSNESVDRMHPNNRQGFNPYSVPPKPAMAHGAQQQHNGLLKTYNTSHVRPGFQLDGNHMISDK